MVLGVLLGAPPDRLENTGPAVDRPNVLLILVDDMGFSDLGCYGGEIDTPNLDRLAANGLRFTQFYNTGRCWTTRASLLTGMYPHQVGHAMIFGPDAPPAYRGTSLRRGRMIQELLQPVGYRCYHVGKWHLDDRSAHPNETWPLRRSFDRSYFAKTQDNYFNPRVVYDDERLIQRPGAAGGYYMTEVLSDRSVEYLKQHQAQHPGQPFFLYLAYTAPHFPLHALPADIAKFRERYLVGWDEVRSSRRRRMKELGIVDCPLSPRDPDAKPWNGLSPDEQRMWAERMALHAAMIHCVDRGVGRIVDQLKRRKALENTLIFFLSDNGASAEYLVRGDGHNPQAPPGSAATYLCLEVGWANAANTPFRFHKMWMHEGGVSTPLIVHWPKGVKNPGRLTRDVGHVIDVFPTVNELTNAEGTEGTRSGVAGKSLAPLFADRPREPHEFLFWEHIGNKALREGDLKLVAEHQKPWELYDLAVDRSETENLASTNPDLVRRMAQRWQEFADRVGVVEWSSLSQSKASPGAEYRRK